MSWFANRSVTPRKAAAVILADDREEREVLMARRNTALAFMGGHHVFPGGAQEEKDHPDLVDGSGTEESRRLIFTVAREVFEETGLILSATPPGNPDRLHQPRIEMLAGERSFSSILETFDIRIDGDSFLPAGIWITPPFSPIRYHTQYYFYRYHGPRYEKDLGPDAEITDLEWMRPADARRRWHEGDGVRLSTPVAFALKQLADFPGDTALRHLVNTPGRDDSIPNRFEPRAGIHIIPLRTSTLPPATHTNCIVIGEKEMVIIDPGAGDPEEQRHFIDHLDNLSGSDNRFSAILLTHCHGDHTGAVEVLRRHYDIPVWAHESAANKGIAIDRHLADNQIIPLEGSPPWRVRCIHTPGHSPEHLCFLEESTGSLCCGDMMANPGTIMISPDHGGDMTRYLEGLERLIAQDFSFTIPAHGMPSWRDSGRDKFKSLIKHRMAREEKIRKAIEAGADSVDAVLRMAYDDTPEAAWPLAAVQLKAHLKRLEIELYS